MNNILQIVVPMALAVILGGSIGVERWFRRKVAGLRTHALVSLGSCIYTLVSVYGFVGMPSSFNVDPSRIVSQIVVGIGFLGAGIIFQKKDFVQGITTAAGIWVTASIGILAGLHMYVAAILATVLTLLVFIVLFYIEGHVPQDEENGIAQ